MAEWCSG